MVSPEEIYLKKTWNPRAIVTGVLVLLFCVMAWYRPEWDDKWGSRNGNRVEALLFPAVFPCCLRLVSFPSTDGAGEQGTPGSLARAFPLSPLL